MSNAFGSFWCIEAVRVPLVVNLLVYMGVPFCGCEWSSSMAARWMGKVLWLAM